MKDTPPDINAMIFKAMMARTPAERVRMGLDMMATARAVVWASLPEGTETERRAAFLRRMYGDELSEDVISAVASFRRTSPGGQAMSSQIRNEL